MPSGSNVTIGPEVTHPRCPLEKEARMITNPQSGTNVHEIASGIYRINTPVALPGEMSMRYGADA